VSLSCAIAVETIQFVFPTNCACCRGKADIELTVLARRKRPDLVDSTFEVAWDIPYCSPCVKHMKLTKDAGVFVIFLGLVSVASGVLCYRVAPFLGIPIGIAGLAGTFVLYKTLMARARKQCCPGCACLGNAVR